MNNVRASMKVQKLIEERLRTSAARLPVLGAKAASRSKAVMEVEPEPESEARARARAEARAEVEKSLLGFDFLTEFRGIVSSGR